MSRRNFLRVGGAGLAGAAFVVVTGCGSGGGSGSEGGVKTFTFSFGPDASGSLQELVRRFNEKYEGRYQAEYREMPADTGQYFNKIRNEFQAGASNIDLVGGDVIWPVQFAESGYIAPLSDRFPPEEQEAFLPAPIEANTYEGEIWAVAGLATERSMIEDGVAPQAVTTFTETESHGAFLRGESVFIRNWPYMYGLISDPELSRLETEQVKIAPLPVGGESDRSFGGLGGWSFYLNAASDLQDAAYAFVEFATSAEQQKIRALEGGFLPTLKELYDDEEILEAVPVARLGREAIQSARPRPLSPYYSDMSLRMAEQFSASLQGEIPPEQAVENLQQSLQEIVDLGQGS
jgi:ABC-type glycerol-3-phosphate transport system substrate-binding protein